MKHSEIENFTTQHAQWVQGNERLTGTYQFTAFAQLQVAVSQILQLADELNHHPMVTFDYSTLQIELQTHDAGNSVTEKDVQFAQRVVVLMVV